VLFAIWFFCFTGNLIVTHLNYLFQTPISYFSVLVVIIFICICFSPFHCFYRKARWSLMRTLGNIAIAPFGLVHFRHFFLADVITSMVTPLKDIGLVFCFFETNDWEDGHLPDTNQCSFLLSYSYTIAFFPYWFRFMQCFNKYHETKLKAHLINAGKYFSCLLICLSAIFEGYSLTQFIIVHFIATTYCFVWDLYMDWGLFRSFDLN